MRTMRKLLMVTLCSFILGLPIRINQRDNVSLNGCTSNTYVQMTNYYHEKKDTIEAIILGDSNIYRGFNPLQLWEDEKVTSYVLASPTQPAWLSYFVLQDALEYQKPRVVVFEINELFAEAKGQTARNCTVINSMRSDATRLKAINNTSGGFDDDDRTVLFQTYANQKFQTMMSTMQHENKPLSTTNNKGYLLNTSVIPMLSGNSYMSRYDMNLNIDQDTQKQIDQIITLCKKEGITLLFTKFPTKEWTSQKSKMAKEYATKRGIPLLDMNTDIDIIDWSKDTKDNGFHMNDFGAQKVTKALSEFMKKQGALHRNNDQATAQNYEQALQRYKEKRAQSITSKSTSDIK